MKAAVLSVSAQARPIWRVHGVVLLVLASVAVACSVLVWLHPTLGYAEPGSIIAGADLRGALTAILWILFAVFAVTATLVVGAASRLTRTRLGPLVAGYAAAAAVLPLVMIVVDRYF